MSDTEDKEDTDKNRNFENFAQVQSFTGTSGSFTKTNLRKIAAITDKVW